MSAFPIEKRALDGASPEGRQRLCENGFEPILLNGKKPISKGWRQHDITTERLQEWEAQHPTGGNTGLRCGEFAVVDIDLLDEDFSAQIVEAVQDSLGHSDFVRTGRAPKRAICYRSTCAIGKITISGRPPNGCYDQKIEFLGQGQQLASFGIHPDTGRPYTWSGATPLDCGIDALPETNPEAIRNCAWAIRDRLSELGFQNLQITGDSGWRIGDQTSANGEPVTVTMLEDMLSWIEPSCPRNEWITVGAGIKSANLVDDVDFEPFEDYDRSGLFDRWSAGELNDSHRPGNYEGPDDCARTYESLSANRPGGATMGTIIKRARDGGYRGDTHIPLILRYRGRSNLIISNDNCSAVVIPTCPSFTRNSKGTPSNTFPNALLAAQHMKCLPEMDEFNHRVVFRRDVPWADIHGRVLDDNLLRAIRIHFLSEFGLDVTREHVSEAVLSIATSNRFHPVREYLVGLGWDGKRRIDTWLINYFSAADTPYVRAVGRKTLLGAVARVLKPGIKFDTMLVLEGAQGIGKSTGIRKLAGDEWFCDGLPPDLAKADAVQAIQGAWIIELSELEGLTRSQVTTIKAFLSRQVDRARFAYERHARDYPRQCVFIASTNEGSYLRDTTGARRFWPVDVTNVNVAALASDRDQLWAEAVHAFRQAESLELPQELWAEAAREQEERLGRDPWEEILRVYLDGKAEAGPTGKRDRIHSNELLSKVLDRPKDRQSKNDWSRLRLIMENRLGWEYRKSLKIDGYVNSGYVRREEI